MSCALRGCVLPPPLCLPPASSSASSSASAMLMSCVCRASLLPAALVSLAWLLFALGHAVELAHVLFPLLLALVPVLLTWAFCFGDDGDEEDRDEGAAVVGRSRAPVALLGLLLLVYLLDDVVHPYWSGPVAGQSFKYKIALITGANSGVGLQAAREIAHGGGRVYLGCRSKTKCAAAAADINDAVTVGPGRAIVAPEPLDITSLASVRKFALALRARALGRLPLDYLLNNAGFPVNGASARPTADGFEAGFGGMHLGHMLLTELLYRQQPDDAQDSAARAAAAAAKDPLPPPAAGTLNRAEDGVSGGEMRLNVDDALFLGLEDEDEDEEGAEAAAERKTQKKDTDAPRFFPGGRPDEEGAGVGGPVPVKKAPCRVVYVASAMHHICHHWDCFPAGYFAQEQYRGRPDRLSYPRAKFLNVVAASELGRRADGGAKYRGWTALAVDLGFVRTTFSPLQDALGMFMRGPSAGVRPVVWSLLLDAPSDAFVGTLNGGLATTMYSVVPAITWRQPILEAVFALPVLWADEEKRRSARMGNDEAARLMAEIWDKSMALLEDWVEVPGTDTAND